jgi:AcrR family transcriptional regulator
MSDAQRARILDAMTDVVAEHGFAAATVKLVTEGAGVSSGTFYECFANLEECFAAVLDLGLAQATELLADAFAREDRWEDGVRAALASVLAFFDSEPRLARVWFVESIATGAHALEQRERIVAQLRRAWRDAAPAAVPPPANPPVPTARRARECLLLLERQPGSSNREIAAAIGVRYQSQISKLLAHLAEGGLASKRSEGAGKRNAWQLTPRGKEMARSLSGGHDAGPTNGASASVTRDTKQLIALREQRRLVC